MDSKSICRFKNIRSISISVRLLPENRVLESLSLPGHSGEMNPQSMSSETSEIHSSELPATGLRRVLTQALAEVKFFARILISSADRYYWDNGFSRAASLAYTSLLSVVPLLALAFGLLASFAVAKEHVTDVRRFMLKQFVPDVAAVDSALAYLARFSESISSMNVLVIFFLIVTSILLLNSVEYALNEVWQVYEPRSIAHRVAIFSAILLIAPALAVSGYYFTTFRVQPLFADFGINSHWQWVYNAILPFLIDLLAFVSLFYLVPKAPVRLRSACIGAFVSALFFAFAKEIYAYYIEKLSTYGTIYTTLAAIPISLLWLYIAWTIILYGVEVSYQSQYLPRQGKLWKRSVLSVGDGQLVLAVQALAVIGQAFMRGLRLPNDLELAEKLGCSTVVLKPTLDALERAQILCRGDSRDMPLTLMRHPERVSLGEIRQALFGGRVSVRFPTELEKVFSAYRDSATAERTSLADILRGNV